ncbi:ATP-dependent DNA ligase [Paenibacillus agilis]|uniref:ATP-dependent DNA ligase n=1 Tax=Paenibacillus agilis TaxID=3020863 RepID=A0A559J067_9BACL|nr:ATP-dependent DNA ligase [Paenibacillus agilis]TVX93260.1 ATP-dependent DNA ligase [Paenibacillus agilis]
MSNITIRFSPMLLEMHDHPFDDDKYIFEPKIDGHRAILTHFDQRTSIYTRYGNNVTRQYPELHRLNWQHDVVLDGEIACNNAGKIDYESVMKRLKTESSMRINILSANLPATFIAFDILWYKNQDLRCLPLIQRKDILSQVCMEGFDQITTIPMFENKGVVLFDYIKEQSIEGIVAKLKDSSYTGKRSSSWLKIINWTFTTVYLVGYHKNDLGWLTSIRLDNGQYKQTGIVQYGMTNAQRKFYEDYCKSNLFKEDNEYVYIEPRIQAKVKIRNWTSNGMLRVPIFIDFVVD